LVVFERVTKIPCGEADWEEFSLLLDSQL